MSRTMWLASLGAMAVVAVTVGGWWIGYSPVSTPSAMAPLKPYKSGDFSALLATYAGKPLMVSFWSVGCAPCRGELSTLRRIIEKRSDINLVLVAADPLLEEERARNILMQAGLADVESWIYADPFVERLRAEANPQWIGILPHAELISNSGDRTAFDGAVDEDMIETWLDKQRERP